MPQQRMNTRDRLRAVDKSLNTRLKRVRSRLLPIFQTSIAAGLAYFVSKDVIGHERPFFAPIAVLLIIGISSGERISKALDIALGCVLGVLVGDLLFYRLGDGGWQIAVIVAGSLLIASFFSKSQLLVNQVAIGSVLIATIMPPGAEVTGIDRTVDAFVGCSIALATLALIPQAPMASARAEISQIMSLMSSVLDDVADGLRTGNPDCIREALDLIRGSQSRIDSMAAAIQSGEETTRLSPFLWGTRRYVNSLALVIPPVDNAVRTTRVLARRALVLCEDDDRVSTEQIMLIDELSEVCLEISEIYDADSKRSSQQAAAIPVLVNQLRGIAQRSGMDVLELEAPQTPAPPTSQTPASENAGAGSDATPAASTPVLSAYAILAQTRSLVVDLLQVCGMSRESALAALAPTSTTPRYQPEQFDL
ncbi:FUSC family protein [Corynebacterium aquatimens]|uniref:FUSC family protein n=1 Tax=Corynebacterium TaxID=1716 RepID=UPI001F17C4AA|nr:MULTISPECIES: FUSC family protein [Corynebacterium]QYH19167.1 FUSC family protein [Corynebacterium aquatimens]UIZ91955.1 FUSC family protein [Corynebacterium sp. CNCTC7651]